MLQDATVAVIVPAFNEESQIAGVVRGLPEFVDRVVVVDDASTDGTAAVIRDLASDWNAARPLVAPPLPRAGSREFDRADRVALRMKEQQASLLTPAETNVPRSDGRLVVITHEVNAGVGAAIASGYGWCRDNRIDCAAVMAGDGQMDPAELEAICLPIATGTVEYVKGNRLIHVAASQVIPRVRLLGNAVLSILTKVASGYWHVSDTQSGYTAISLRALDGLDLHKIYRRYGMPNDLLIRLNTGSFTIQEVPIKPVYGVGEQSKMKIGRSIPRIVWLLIRGFVRRLFAKYLVLDFHPLFICYAMFAALGVLDVFLFSYLLNDLLVYQNVNENYLMVTIVVSILLVQFLLFGMWFDMQDNERLQK